MSAIVSAFAHALGNALILLGASAVISTLLGALLATLDIGGGKLMRAVLRLYRLLAQTTPPLILLFLAFYGTTALGYAIKPMSAAVLAFVVFATAYYYEIFRASFAGVPKSQFEAARALGVPPLPFAVRVVIPQVIRIAAAPYIGRTTILFKETSLASAISVSEIMSTSSAFIYSGANPLVMIALAGALYATINMVLIGIEKRLARPEVRR